MNVADWEGALERDRCADAGSESKTSHRSQNIRVLLVEGTSNVLGHLTIDVTDLIDASRPCMPDSKTRTFRLPAVLHLLKRRAAETSLGCIAH